MLLKYLNSNRPATLLLLPFFTLMLWLPIYLYGNEPVSNMVNHYNLLFKKDLVASGLPGFCLAMVFSMGVGILLNRIIVNTELSVKTSHIYAFTYVLVEFMMRTDYGFYTWQISQMLLLLALWSLFKIANQRHVIDLSFQAGLCIGIAALIYPPALLYFCVIPIFLQLFRPFNWREWFFPFIGVFVVVFFYCTYKLSVNQSFYTYFLFVKFNHVLWFKAQMATNITLGVLILFALASYSAGINKAIMYARKQRSTMLYLFIILLILLFGLNTTGYMYGGYYMLCIPMALFTGHFLGQTRLINLRELIFIVLVFSQVVKYLPWL